MLFSLRNDVVAIEYPIQHFLSEGIRNGDFPVWFNTWGMGFPLQSILSWGVYSTPQMLTGLFFPSNMYVLHAEFIFFIITAGCSMYKLLRSHFTNDLQLSLLLALCYMLSGFTVGSSQWLLYITGMTFIPLVLYALLSLIKKPSFKYCLLFAISFYLFFTNVHIYLTIFTSYILLFLLLVYFIRLFISNNKTAKEKIIVTGKIALAFLLTLVICAAPIYYSIEVIKYLARSQPISNDTVFFQSNYLHPDGLSSLLLPLSSIKTLHSNTEGIILDTYIGLLSLLLLPVSILINIKQRNSSAWALLGLSILFLLISFGHLTPIRGWLNILPGMSHFRHPGVLRIFFILAFILYLGKSFGNYKIVDLFKSKSPERKSILIATGALLFLSLLAFLISNQNIFSIWKGSIYETIKLVDGKTLSAVNALIQSIALLFILFSIAKRRYQLFSFLIITELILNTVICTPFFSISAYSVKEVNNLLQSPRGFPVQQSLPYQVNATFIDNKGNAWPNVNTYKKEISSKISMPGPIILNRVALFLEKDSSKKWLAGKQFIFINDTTLSEEDSLIIIEQLPDRVSVRLQLSSPKEIILLQGNFPGWNAYYNNSRLNLSVTNSPFVSTIAPAGKGILVFKFEKPGVFYSAIILHLIVVSFLLFLLIRKIRSR